MAKIRSNSPNLGQKFGKPDIERVGLFSELPYLTAQTRPKKKTEREPHNMYSEGRKSKTGTQHGYFETEFRRIFSKEAIKGRGRKPGPPRMKNVSDRPFMPPAGFKTHSCPGDYYGSFSGVIHTMGNERRKQPPRKSYGRNLLGNPGKLGGPGYADICINKFPEYSADRYGVKPKYPIYGKNLGRAIVPVHYPQPFFDKNPFVEPANIKPGPTYVRPKEKKYLIIPPGHIVPSGPGKKQGGCHGGCFNPFPEHKADRYGVKPKNKPEKAFGLSGNGLKSYYNTSILFQNVDKRVNAVNFKEIQPTYNKYLIT